MWFKHAVRFKMQARSNVTMKHLAISKSSHTAGFVVNFWGSFTHHTGKASLGLDLGSKTTALHSSIVGAS